MKNSLYILAFVYAFIAALISSACSSMDFESTLEPEGIHTCRLVWNGDITGIGNNSRATRDKQDGDCVFLRFKVGNSYVDGSAVYDLESDEWSLTYNGSLAVGTPSSCTVHFIEGIDESAAPNISLSHRIMVCSDLGATYTRESGYMKLSASLTPNTGRIRFKGDAGKKFTLSGVEHYSSFNAVSGELSRAQTPIELTVADNGYTPYVYAAPTSNRTLTIYYDFQTYKTACESPILDAGRSGYMLLPTEDAHNSWSLVKVEVPTLSAVSMGVISDVNAEVNASVLSTGNGTLFDAGFVYSTSKNPTLESSKKASCDATTTLRGTLLNLAPGTTYYVRAYATNERGTAYSEQISFTTTATPTVPDVTTGIIRDITSNSAIAEGTIVSLGEVSSISSYGHVWSTTDNPTLADNKTDFGPKNSTGSYTSTLTGLLPNTKYYVRAYATNSVGTSYGNAVSFYTSSIGAGTVIDIVDFGDDRDWN